MRLKIDSVRYKRSYRHVLWILYHYVIGLMLQKWRSAHENYSDEDYEKDVVADSTRLKKQYLSWSQPRFLFVFGILFLYMFLVRVAVTAWLLCLIVVYSTLSSSSLTFAALVCLTVINIYFLCKFFLFGACALQLPAAKRKSEAKADLPLPTARGLLRFLTLMSRKHDTVRIALRLCVSIPIRTVVAYRTSLAIADVLIL